MLFKDVWWELLIFAAAAYLLGSVNFSILISKIKGRDIRKLGSGNPGTMNMSRNFGLAVGLLVFCLDILKGVLPALVSVFVFDNIEFVYNNFLVTDLSIYLCGFFSVLGHIFPLFTRFKGGKGIATTIGVFLVGEPIVGLIFMFVALAFILITAMGSMGSLIAITPPAISALIHLYNHYIAGGQPKNIIPVVLTDFFVLGICMLTWIAHRNNIKRLLRGEEHQTTWSEMIKKLKLKLKEARKLKKQQNAAAAENADNKVNSDGEQNDKIN